MQHVESTLGPDVPIIVWSPRDGARFSLDELAAYLAEVKDRISAQPPCGGAGSISAEKSLHAPVNVPP